MRRAGTSTVRRGEQLESEAMAGVFDIDLDQPEENVSDDELEDGVWKIVRGTAHKEEARA